MRKLLNNIFGCLYGVYKESNDDDPRTMTTFLMSIPFVFIIFSLLVLIFKIFGYDFFTVKKYVMIIIMIIVMVIHYIYFTEPKAEVFYKRYLEFSENQKIKWRFISLVYFVTPVLSFFLLGIYKV